MESDRKSPLSSSERRFFDIISSMVSNSKETKHIVVSLRMAGIAGQDKLSGIFEYLSEGHRWNLSIYRQAVEFTPKAVRHEIQRGADGFIVGIPGTERAIQELAKYDIPIAVINLPLGPLAKRKENVFEIRQDATEIGLRAAQTFMNQGIFESYGYIGSQKDELWSRGRGAAFNDFLRKNGFSCQMFDVDHFGDQVKNKLTLLNWLKALPKPCGLFAACDDLAYELINLCNEEGFLVPQEIGVLGVNNDPMLCENTTPKISSIQPDCKREGYLAAQAIDQLLVQPMTLVGIRQVVLRESTSPISYSGRLVQNALSFIKKNADKKITVLDVAKHLHVSRALLDLRFRELQKKSVRQSIVSIRLEELMRRLKTTQNSIELVATACGWENFDSLKKIFKRQMGLSLSQWAKENKSA